MNIEQAMSRLYESEINCGLESFWDSGVTAWIGDEMNGRKAEQLFHVDDIAKIPDWIISKAQEIYPLAFFESEKTSTTEARAVAMEENND